MISEFAQNDFDARQGEEALVGFNEPVVPDQDASLESEPRVGAFHDVSQPVAMRPRVLPKFWTSTSWSSIMPLWDDRRDPTTPQRLAKGLAVVSAIAQKPSRLRSASSAAAPSDRDFGQDAVGDLQFMDICPLNNEGERRSSSVDEDFSFCALANLGDTDATTPFLAGAKLASKMPCESFNRPRLPSCPNRARRTRVQTPSRCQRTSRSQQVAGAPYSRGMSFQRQPVLSTNRMPLMVRRSSTLLRPRRFFRGSSGWMSFQSFADRSVSLMWGSFSAKEQSLRI